MLTFVMRWAALAVSALFAVVAWTSWTRGEPPPWAFFAPRLEASVVESRVESGRIPSGEIRHTPGVRVDAGRGPEDLRGAEPTFYDYDLEDAEEIIARYPVGERIAVRRIGGVVMADRVDLFKLGHAAFMSVMTLVIAVMGLLMSRVFATGRKKP